MSDTKAASVVETCAACSEQIDEGDGTWEGKFLYHFGCCPPDEDERDHEPRGIQQMNDFTAILTDPSGDKGEYTVRAKNKTEARQKIAAIYRRNTPNAKNGFYSFGQNRLTWEAQPE